MPVYLGLKKGGAVSISEIDSFRSSYWGYLRWFCANIKCDNMLNVKLSYGSP